MVKLLASPAAITSSRDRLLSASPLAPRRLVKSLQAFGDALLRRFVWGFWSDAERVPGCQPLDLVAFSNCELIGECLGNGHLQLTRDFGHRLTLSRNRILHFPCHGRSYQRNKMCHF